jgi:cyclopropane fatty-acyl-phospholipid synthase-like methyltransferase
LLRQRLEAGQNVVLHRADVRWLSLDLEADVVFSVGLIEHFEPAGTRRAVEAHFELLKPGGLALLSFPTPTWLYRAARRLTELAGLWRFPDERPLARAEVLAAVSGLGQVVFQKTMWPLVFTQHLIAVRKAPTPSGAEVRA